MDTVRSREYRFVGGPAHGERRKLSDSGVHETYRVPVYDGDPPAAYYLDETPTPLNASMVLKVALYVLDGDYPDEWFYRFHSYLRG